MNPITFAAFGDELEKIASSKNGTKNFWAKKKTAFIANLGTKIVHTLKPAYKAGAELMHRGWNTGGGGKGALKGWMGAGKDQATSLPGKIYENVASLGGLTKHLPVGPKALTVGFGALGAKDALKKEDESGQGRSRAERMGSVIGGTAAGIAGGAMGLPGAVATGIAGDYLGGRAGRAIKGRTPKPAPIEPQAPVNG